MTLAAPAVSRPVDVTRALAIDGWMLPRELAWLAHQATTCAVIIEVGSYLGRSTRALGDHVQRVVYAVDLWRGFDSVPAPEGDAYLRAFRGNLADLLSRGRVKVARMDSLRWTPPATVRGAVDLVFLDGDHDEAHVRAEILRYRAWLRPGGLVVGHDFGSREHPGVTAAVRSLVPTVRRGPKSLWWATKEQVVVP